MQAVRRAAQLVRQVQAEIDPGALTKGDRSPVTVADFASQALVGHWLESAFPADPLVAEEDSAALRSPEAHATLAAVTDFVGRWMPAADAHQVCAWIDRGRAETANRFWTLDPIDGTRGFLRGDQYAVALALVEAGQVVLGVLGCPNLTLPELPSERGVLAVAARGQGAWVAPLDKEAALRPLVVSDQSQPASARLLRSFEAGHTNVDQVDALAARLGTRLAPVRMDSQAKYAVLAAGGGELMVRLLSPERPDYREKIWDQAAGGLILEEAGGRITDLDGAPLDFSTGRTLARNRGVLASNGRLHLQALEALRAIGA